MIKKVIRTVKNKLDDMKHSKDKKEKLAYWQGKLETSKADFDEDIFDDREQLYYGTREIDPNINTNRKVKKKANNVNNIIYELIESQIDTQIPEPSVRTKREGFEEQARMIEDSISNDLKELEIEEINDVNERITPVQGYSFIVVDWDPDYKHNLYRGELRLTSVHPKQIIPQPGVWKLQKMDYFFILSSVTKGYIKHRYGIDMDEANEEFPEVNTIDGGSQQNNQNEKVTEVICFYRDDDGDVGKYVYCDTKELEDYPKYFYRKQDVCTNCEAPRGFDDEDKPHEQCQACGNNKFKKSNKDTVTLIEDTEIFGGEVLGAFDEVPHFTPTRYPITMRKNVPKNFSFGGQSDVDVIRDQQDSIKKVATKVEEKIVKGGSLIIMPDDVKVQITDETYQVVNMTAAQRSAVQTLDLTAPIERDLNYLQQQYEVAKSMLGITDSFQGKDDSSAKSGIAKQIQVEQASGRLQSKQFNKYTHFKELFEIMFEFKLAFYDEIRPFVATDKNGKDIFQVFDKYKFLVRDAQGKLYYNTDFMFSADAGQGLPKDRIFLYNQAKEMLGSGALDVIQYWTLLESLNFPMASQILQQIEQKQAEGKQNQIMTIIQTFAQMAPEEREAFFNAPPEAQAELMQGMMEQLEGDVQ